MADTKNKIGHVLEETAEKGTLGRKPITSLQQSQTPTAVTRQEQARSKEETEERKYYQKTSKHPEWKKQTLLFPPALITWLKIQAAIEGREMSEIAVEALEMYRQLHPTRTPQE